MSDNVNHPAHYTQGPIHPACGEVVECITVTEGHNFNVGNAIKYLWRADHKGNALEDLAKAAQYIQFERERRQYAAQVAEATEATEDAFITDFRASIADTMTGILRAPRFPVVVTMPDGLTRAGMSEGTHGGPGRVTAWDFLHDAAADTTEAAQAVWDYLNRPQDAPTQMAAEAERMSKTQEALNAVSKAKAALGAAGYAFPKARPGQTSILGVPVETAH